ncbi:T9SS type A sorting domain-containing protein [Marinilabilia sp.]|uniref:T9SS type A sorting domain-containing protein n=1 Tax=Marinilabilia sp. TaxID=2021252 RepID=UPI0025C109D2|nr:T9SS type A sorting domain-containing protein [Marinilabilia sp.]
MRKIFLLFALFCILPAFGQGNSLPSRSEIYDVPEIDRFQEFLSGNTSDAPFYTVTYSSNTTTTKRGHLYRIDGRDSEFELNTCGSEYDTYLYVFESNGDDWECITRNDDNNSSCPNLSGLNSKVVFSTDRGKDYLVFVSGWGSSSGYYELNVFEEFDEFKGKHVFSYFSVPGQTEESEINIENNTIDIFCPMGTDLSSLAATFENVDQDGTFSVKVDGQVQQSGVTKNDFSRYIQYEVSADDGSLLEFWLVRVHEILPDGQRPVYDLGFSTFSLNGQSGDSFIDWPNKTIELEVPHDVDVSNLVAQFSISRGQRIYAESRYIARVNGVNQISGNTENNFTNYLTYELSTVDGSVSSFWTIKVIRLFPSDEIWGSNPFFRIPEQVGESQFADGQVNIEMPHGTDLKNLRPEFNLARGVKVYVDGDEQISGVTPQDFSSSVRYELVSENGLNTVFVYVAVETLPGSSQVEISAFQYYYSLEYFSTVLFGSIDNENRTINLTVPGSVSLIGENDYSYNIRLTLNRDASYAGEFVSISYSGTTRRYSINHDLTANNKLSFIAQDGTEVQYEVVIEKLPVSKSVDFSYIFLGSSWDYRGKLNEDKNEITFTMPYGTDLSQLIGYIDSKTINTYYINGRKIGVRAVFFTVDLSKPVVLTVEAEDGVTQKFWDLKVEFEEPSSEANFTGFSLRDAEGRNISDNYTIDSENNEIRVVVPYGYLYEEMKDLNNLTASFSLSSGAKAYIGSKQEFSGVGTLNFTGGMTYFLTAQDDLTTEIWNVKISVTEPGRRARVDAVRINDGQMPVSIDHEAGEILVHASTTADVSSVKAGFSVSPKARIYRGSSDELLSKEESFDLNETHFLKVVSQDKNKEKEYALRVSPGEPTNIKKEQDGLLEIFPNPASEVIYIDVPGNSGNDVVVKIFDLEGKKAFEQEFNILNKEDFPVDVSDLKPGIYFLHLETGSKVFTQKIVIK